MVQSTKFSTCYILQHKIKFILRLKEKETLRPCSASRNFYIQLPGGWLVSGWEIQNRTLVPSAWYSCSAGQLWWPAPHPCASTARRSCCWLQFAEKQRKCPVGPINNQGSKRRSEVTLIRVKLAEVNNFIIGVRFDLI